MEFPEVTYRGPEPDDREVLEKLPDDLRGFLEEDNGLVGFHGGLHVRGASKEPAWHSLREVWSGSLALHELYRSVHADDIPFAQDAVGDQWLLRDGEVIRLEAETGSIEPLGQSSASSCGRWRRRRWTRSGPATERVAFLAHLARHLAG